MSERPTKKAKLLHAKKTGDEKEMKEASDEDGDEDDAAERETEIDVDDSDDLEDDEEDAGEEVVDMRSRSKSSSSFSAPPLSSSSASSCDSSFSSSPPSSSSSSSSPVIVSAPAASDSSSSGAAASVVVSSSSASSSSARSSSSFGADNECCVCLEVVDLPLTTACGHIFCFLCLKGVFTECQRHFVEPACPLCRAKIDPAFFEKAKLTKAEYERRQASSTVEYQWKYSGRGGGWWFYDNQTNELIEKYYQTFLSSGPPPPDAPFSIRVGADKYAIDFVVMRQVNLLAPGKKRTIQREAKKELFATHEAGVKGQAGVKFLRTPSLLHLA